MKRAILSKDMQAFERWLQCCSARQTHRPIASTSDWTRWNDALVVSMWVLIFTRWCMYYLGGRSMAHLDLDDLSPNARELAMRRPMEEWQPRGPGQLGEYAAFLKQVEGLLTSTDWKGSETQ